MLFIASAAARKWSAKTEHKSRTQKWHADFTFNDLKFMPLAYDNSAVQSWLLIKCFMS